MNDPGWVTIAEYGAVYEAELAAGRLESAGIPSRVDQRGGIGLFGPGHTGLSVRGVALQVPATVVDAARQALDLEVAP